MSDVQTDPGENCGEGTGTCAPCVQTPVLGVESGSPALELPPGVGTSQEIKFLPTAFPLR